jgi:hypothetical protein
MKEIEHEDMWEGEGGFVPREKEEFIEPAVEPETSSDPLDPSNIGAVQTITLLRIYDVLMAILTEKDPDAADRLSNIHDAGEIVQESIGFNYGGN